MCVRRASRDVGAVLLDTSGLAIAGPFRQETNMTQRFYRRAATMLAAGAVLLQTGGCMAPGLLDLVQTVFLGVTAAGSLAILNNL